MVAPQSNFAEVHINGNYHGMYVNSESINSDFQDDYLYADPDNTRLSAIRKLSLEATALL